MGMSESKLDIDGIFRALDRNIKIAKIFNLTNTTTK